MKKILLIDGNSIINRAFYATMNVLLRSPSGVYTNGIYGFLNILFSQIEEENPTHIAVAFDLKSPTKRHEMYSEYKAGRHKMPTELTEQFPYLKQILRAMNISVLENPGDEADDILGSIAKQFPKDNNIDGLNNTDMQICILTGDRDYFQLVDKNIYIKYPKTYKGKTEYLIYNEEKIKEEYGLKPIELIEVKGLMGDASDNIPGVKGVGEKTAIKLIQDYNSIEGIYKGIDENSTNIKGTVLNKLITDREMAFLSKKLGEINININLKEVFNLNLDKIKYSTWKNIEVYNIFKELNLKSLIQKYDLENIGDNNDTLEEKSETEKKKIENLNKLNVSELYNETILKSDVDILKKYLFKFNNDVQKKSDNLKDNKLNVYSYIESNTEDIYNQFKKQIEYIEKNNIAKTDDKDYKDDEVTTEKINEDNCIYLSYMYKKYTLPSTTIDGENITKELLSKETTKLDKYILDNFFGLNKFREDELIQKYYSSISKQESKYISILINYMNKTYIYTYDIDKVKNVLISKNIPKVAHGFKKFKVEALENDYDINNMYYDTKIANYLLDSSLNQYDIINTCKRVFNLDIEDIIQNNIYIRNYYDIEVKQDKKDVLKLRKLLDSLGITLDIENNYSDINTNKNINKNKNNINTVEVLENCNFLDDYYNKEHKKDTENKKEDEQEYGKEKQLDINTQDDDRIINVLDIIFKIIGDVKSEIELSKKDEIISVLKEDLISKRIFNDNINKEFLEVEDIEEYFSKLEFNITKKKKEQILDVLNVLFRNFKIQQKISEIQREKNILPLIIYFEYLKTKEELKKISAEKLFKEIEMKTVELLAELQYNGIFLDAEYLNKLMLKLQTKIDEKEKQIMNYSVNEINVNSPKQLGILLYEELELPVIKKNKTGYATDVDTLKKLEDKHEIITYILEYRELNKLKSTYGQSLIDMVNVKTGRIHSNFHQTITATGRISSQEPNLQNIPTKTELGQEIRRAFIPKKGYIYLDADYSQIELRVLADMSGDEMMQKAFKEKKDIHKSTASNIFNIPEESVTKEIRSYAKAVNFGIIYGMSDYGLSEVTGISVKEAKEYIKKYLEYYSKVSEYMDSLKEKAKKDGFVETKYLRRRYTPQAQSPNYLLRQHGYRVAMNAPIQGTAADIMKIAIYNVYKKLKDNNLESKVILQVHDEIIIETKEQEKELVEKILKTEMENAAKLSVDLEVEVGEGINWQDAKI